MSNIFQSRHSSSLLPFCGCFVIDSHERKWLPMINLDAHATILSSTSRTTLTQTFVNPRSDSRLDEVSYDFPLYDGVSVVGFMCTIGSRVIRGVVKEREMAKKTFNDAVSRGETAGLLQQNASAADIFTTTLGNVPAGETVKVEVTYLGELEHDAEVDGVRWTLPKSIAPRYGGSRLAATRQTTATGGKMSVTVDAEMADGCSINTIQSPSHPISVSIGRTSAASGCAGELPLLRRASASLSLGSTELDKDFVVLIVAAGLGNPAALLEMHPSGSRALMTTLVPKFNLPVDKPEIVFVCDRSGSMGVDRKIPNLIAALQIFLRSLPVGVRFNICSFGSQHSFLWDRSRIYDQDSLDQAAEHVRTFDANFGGTEMYEPLEDTFKRRYVDMNLEVFLLTDGEIWDQERLFSLINENVEKSKGAIRIFTLGVGDEASSSLLNGAARAGGGFAQRVAADEKLDKKIIRMLKGALTPHIADYALEVKYDNCKAGSGRDAVDDNGDDFEIIERVMDSLSVDVSNEQEEHLEPESKGPISLFNPDVDDKDLEMPDFSATIEAKFKNLPEVAHPRYLQTPIQIPALFPFSRTSVYILLSESAPRHEPTSVVLTGTSDHGPLRLEIPITKVAGPAVTIHQLAARNAMQELEEGRGWMAHAKDAEGKLLKAAFEGRFKLMVQREAVRLGVKYQVAGKWCSFVAMLNKGDGDQETEQGGFEVLHPITSPAASPAMFSSSVAPKIRMQSMAKGPGGGGFRGRGGVRGGGGVRGFGGGRGGHVMASHSMPRPSVPYPPPPPPAPTAALFGGPAPGVANVSLSRSQLSESETSIEQPIYGSAAPRGGSFGSIASEGKGDYKLAPEDMKEEKGPVHGPGADDTGRRDCSNGSLAALAALQTFIGSWAWSPELERVISVKHQQVLGLQLPAVPGKADQSEILATLCAVVFFKKRLASEMDAWELIVDKAERWLEDQTMVAAAALEKIVEDAGMF